MIVSHIKFWSKIRKSMLQLRFVDIRFDEGDVSNVFASLFHGRRQGARGLQ